MNDFYSNNDFQPSATNPNFETDTLINMNQDMTSKKAKDEMKNMLEQMALDPSFIIQAQDPEVLQELSAILKEGNTIRGLTTAASIWAVACIGLAVGSGYYFVSILATFAIFLILETVSRFEIKLAKKRSVLSYNMQIEIIPGLIGLIGTTLREYDCKVISMSINNFDDHLALIKVTIKHPRGFKEHALVDVLSNIEGVKTIERLSNL